MRQVIEGILAEIKPLLQADGGDIELLGVTQEGVVRVRLKGLCADCGGSLMTLRQGVERMLKEKVPEVLRVEIT